MFDRPAAASLVPPFAVALGVLLSSWLANRLFGHPTFHRERWKSTTSWWRRLPGSNEALAEEDALDVTALPEGALTQVASFLQPRDLVALGRVSKNMRQPANGDVLWKRLCGLAFGPDLERPEAAGAWKDHFFKVLRLRVQEAASDEYHIIHGSVYNLSSFADVHPGGASILEEWKGFDSTEAFEGFTHSGTARQMMRAYVVWDVANYLTSFPHPQFTLALLSPRGRKRQYRDFRSR